MFALFWIIFRKPQEKYLNYFQERLRQLNFLPVEEVGLYVCMVRGGMLTALALLYSEEIKICQTVCIFQWKSSNFCITSQATEKSFCTRTLRKCSLETEFLEDSSCVKHWASGTRAPTPRDTRTIYLTAYKIQKVLLLYMMQVKTRISTSFFFF